MRLGEQFYRPMGHAVLFLNALRCTLLLLLKLLVLLTQWTSRCVPATVVVVLQDFWPSKDLPFIPTFLWKVTVVGASGLPAMDKGMTDSYCLLKVREYP